MLGGLLGSRPFGYGCSFGVDGLCPCSPRREGLTIRKPKAPTAVINKQRLASIINPPATSPLSRTPGVTLDLDPFGDFSNRNQETDFTLSRLSKERFDVALERRIRFNV